MVAKGLKEGGVVANLNDVDILIDQVFYIQFLRKLTQ